MSELWEVAQGVYTAFDIRQATGDALDALCLLGGVTRLLSTPSTCLIEAYGTTGTVIAADSQVKNAYGQEVFATDSAITLNTTACSGVQLAPSVVSNSTSYTLSYQVIGIHSSLVPVTITSDSSASSAEIVAALLTAINTSHSTYLSATLQGAELMVDLVDKSRTANFTTVRLSVPKVKKTVSATATALGPSTIPAGYVTNIQSPVVGWLSATNPLAVVSGTNDETDDELRTRFSVTKYKDGTNSYEAMYAAILSLEGVVQVVLYENDTDTAFVTPPVPAHSFFPIVLGGNTVDIAKAIWNNKPGGIQSYGGIVTPVSDSQGIAHDVGFSRPDDVEVYISLTIVKDSTYPSDGDTQIKDALIAYFSTLKIGQDVLYSRLFTPVNSIAGHYIDSLTIGTSPSPTGTTNISVDYYQRAVVSAANIVITS